MSTVPEPRLIMQELQGTLPKDQASPIGILLYNLLGLIIFMGFALICWHRYEKKQAKENKK